MAAYIKVLSYLHCDYKRNLKTQTFHNMAYTLHVSNKKTEKSAYYILHIQHL
jgi:hypothetical protein